MDIKAQIAAGGDVVHSGETISEDTAKQIDGDH